MFVPSPGDKLLGGQTHNYFLHIDNYQTQVLGLELEVDFTFAWDNNNTNNNDNNNNDKNPHLNFLKGAVLADKGPYTYYVITLGEWGVQTQMMTLMMPLGGVVLVIVVIVLVIVVIVIPSKSKVNS